MVTSSQELLLHRITQTYETNKHFKELLENIINNKNNAIIKGNCEVMRCATDESVKKIDHVTTEKVS